jgi:hypothetical protein
MSRKNRRTSNAKATIIASLELAQQYAQIIAAASSNHNDNNHQPDTDGQRITESTAAAVTRER